MSNYTENWAGSGKIDYISLTGILLPLNIPMKLLAF